MRGAGRFLGERRQCTPTSPRTASGAPPRTPALEKAESSEPESISRDRDSGGPSGCGKTTLLNLLAAVDRASSGDLVVDGEDLSGASERTLETYRLRKVGFVFQLFNLIPSMTALENLEMPMMIGGLSEGERRKRAEGLLTIVGLGAKAGKRPEELSGGEQQRVAVALALANDPALILADEPTGNLDTENAVAVTRLLLSLSTDHGKTVVLVSHDPAVVREFPSVRTMRDGRFVDGG